jgi:hypothetical protein
MTPPTNFLEIQEMGTWESPQGNNRQLTKSQGRGSQMMKTVFKNSSDLSRLVLPFVKCNKHELQKKKKRKKRNRQNEKP